VGHDVNVIDEDPGPGFGDSDAPLRSSASLRSTRVQAFDAEKFLAERLAGLDQVVGDGAHLAGRSSRGQDEEVRHGRQAPEVEDDDVATPILAAAPRQGDGQAAGRLGASASGRAFWFCHQLAKGSQPILK
jgi:hypothetical protein